MLEDFQTVSASSTLAIWSDWMVSLSGLSLRERPSQGAPTHPELSDLDDQARSGPKGLIRDS